MPRKGATRRIGRYRDKLTPERVRETFEKRRQEMLDNQQAATAELTTYEDRVKAVLNESPVGVLDYIKYHNFWREVYRTWKTHGGGYGLKQEVAILIAKYKARECREDVLIKIRNDVFAIDEP